MVARAGYSVRTVNDLKAIPASALTQDSVRFLGEKEAWYYFAPGSTDSDNGDTVIAPNSGSGRWKRQLVLGGSPGGDGGDGDENPDLTNLQNRVTNLEDLSPIIFNEISTLQGGKLSIQGFLSSLKFLMRGTQNVYTATGLYDSGSNTTAFYAPGFDSSSTFFFKAALSIDNSIQYQPVSIEYVDASLVPSGYENGFNPHVKVVLTGNVTATINIYTELFLDSLALDSLVDTAYYGAGGG